MTDRVGPGAHLLVTGGAGFIGSELVRQVMARRDGTRITVLDKLTYAGNRANLAAVEEDPEQAARFAFVHGDIADPAVVDPLVAEADAVLNVAAETHVDRSILDPEAFLRTGRHRRARPAGGDPRRGGEGPGRPLPPGEHGRGVRGHPRRSQRGDGSAGSTQPVRSRQGQLGAARPRLPHHLWAGRGADPGFQHLRPAPASREADPAVHDERPGRRATPDVRGRDAGPRLAPCLGPCRRHRLRPAARGIRRGLQRGRRQAAAQPRGHRPPARGRGAGLEPGADRSRSPGPRPPLRHGRLQAGRSRLGAARRLRGWAPRERSPGTATTPSGSRARGAATGTATTSASTGRDLRPAAPSSSRARRAEGGAGRRRRGQRAARARAGRGARERPLHRDSRPDRLGPAGAGPRYPDRGVGGRIPGRRAARGRHPYRRLDGRGRLCARPGARAAPQRHRRRRARPRLRPARHRHGVHLDQRGLRWTEDRRDRLWPRRRAKPDQPVRRRQGRGRAPGDRGIRGRRRARPPRHRADLVAPRSARR